MSLRVELSPFGPPAFTRLSELVEEAKCDDPLAPATVIVPRGTLGLAVRRTLAARVPDAATGRGGVANVTCVTLRGLADTLVEGLLASTGRRPMTDAVLRAAMDQTLAQGVFPLLGPARRQPSAIDALGATYRELRNADDGLLERVAATGARAAEVVEVLRGVREKTAPWYDDADLFAAATGEVVGGRDLGRLGRLVLFLPPALDAVPAGFLRTLGRATALTALVGVTGDPRADDLARSVAVALDPALRFEDPAPGVTPAVGTRVVSAPTADAEVHLVVRDLMRRCEAGVPLEQMAILHAGTSQYGVLLHDALRLAGIPHNGGEPRPLSSTTAGRILLGALRLPERDWRREDVTAWLVTGPIRHRGRPLPSALWDTLSIEANVSSGLTDWRVRLARFAKLRRRQAESGDPETLGDDAGVRSYLLRQAEQADELLGFLDDLAEVLSESPASWSQWAAWAQGLLRRLVGSEAAVTAEWPSDELAGFGAVTEAIDRIAVLDELDELGSRPHRGAVVDALVAELSQPAPQTTRYGVGVWVAPLHAASGHLHEVVYVVGMSDTALPGRPGDDALVPDSERRAAVGESRSGALPLRGDRVAALRRDYLAVLAGAKSTVLSYARGNQRDGQALRPSRWLLDTLQALVGQQEKLYASGLAELEERHGLDAARHAGEYVFVPSYIAGVRSESGLATVDDRDLRSLLGWTEGGAPADRHPLSGALEQLGRGLAFEQGFRSGFSRYDGMVGATPLGRTSLEGILSPTRLQSYAACPRRYLFETVLDVTAGPSVEDPVSIDPATRGSLLHRIFEQYVNRQRDAGVSEVDIDLLLRIGEREMHEVHEDGRAGSPAAWLAERTRLRRELRRFVADEHDWRVREGLRNEATERSFGFEGDARGPVVLSLASGGSVRFHGVIDRVDVRRDGSRVVTDYKTGSTSRYQDMKEDPFLGGLALQLPVYGLAEAGTGDPATVTVRLWFASEKGNFAYLPYQFALTPEALGRFAETVDILVGGIHAGHFPAHPGGMVNQNFRHCGYCPFDRVCPPGRDRVWLRTRQAPDLARYVELAGDD
ncbi:MAG TPA: PD-(D/E)XK nuclease family protein [Acidimicrobiales bacterium]|nr:PD-(D/E)XK nuclease family protein [Acidimicrobiales bacterium]